VASWRVEPDRLSGTWFAYRQVAPDTAPLFHSAGERAPSQRSGRWHREGEGYAQYLAVEPAGAWAELVRYEEIRAHARASQYLRRLWLVYVEESGIADLMSFQAYEDCGLDPQLAVAGHQDSQRLADELRDHGYRGLFSPSAALPGATNLTLFGQRYEKILQTAPHRWTNPNPEVRLACHLAAEASPLEDLVTQTCFPGMVHDAYRDHLRKVGKPEPSDPP
jgi:RES domain